MQSVLDLSEGIKQLCDQSARGYDQQHGHGFCSEKEKRAWVRVLCESPLKANQKCLEVGAGTGVFTRLLSTILGEKGFLVAQDISPESLRFNKANLPAEYRDMVEFCEGDAHDRSALSGLEKNSLDVIVARQSVVLLQDPLTVFRIWREYLKEDGHLLIYDALWTRKSWSGDWSKLIDVLPLSCLQSIQTIPYLLTHAGYSIEDVRFLEEINALLGDDGVECPRFAVVAS